MGKPISKEDLIGYLASLTPDEINKIIKEEGKEPKLIEPLYFFNDDQ